MGNKLLLCTLWTLCCCAFIARAQPCPDSLLLTTPADNFDAGYQHLEAQAFIEASNQVVGSAKITYDAGDYVLLQPGFYASASERFWALIDGCGGTFTDIKEIAWLDGTTAVPNPTTGQIQVKLAQPSDQLLGITCFDLMGRELLYGELLAGSITADLDISILPPGIYLLRLSGNQTSQGIILRVVRQ